MATPSPSTHGVPTAPRFSCIRCAGRKVRCDRHQPCSACVKHNVECTYKAAQATVKRRKRVKVRELADRIKQYEMLLQERGVDVDGGITSPKVATQSAQIQLPTPQSITPEQAPNIDNPYVDNSQLYKSQTSFKFVEKYAVIAACTS